MPLALDPDKTFDLVLKSDQDKPVKEQPIFTFRFLANRQWKVIAHLADHLDEEGEEGIESMLTRMEGALRMALLGWRNMIDPATGEEIPFAPENLDRLVNPAEMSELIFGILEAVRLSEEDKKKFESPLPSSSDASARPATPRRPAKADRASKNP